MAALGLFVGGILGGAIRVVSTSYFVGAVAGLAVLWILLRQSFSIHCCYAENNYRKASKLDQIYLFT